MKAAKAKPTLAEATNQKSPTFPKARPISRNGAAKVDSGSQSPMHKQISPQSKLRTSLDQSPRSVDSNPWKPSYKATTTPDKLPRASKVLEMQMKLDAVEEELKNVREQLISVEQEKVKAIDELSEAKKLAIEADERLEEAIASKKEAEDNLEIERFRADELEQAGIEVARREEESQKELENIRNQYALNTTELFSMTEELENTKEELENVIEEKNIALKNLNIALTEANDAKNTAEMTGNKVEILTTEIGNLKVSLESKNDDIYRMKLELADALEDRKSLLEQADDVKKYAEMNEEKVEALSTEIIWLKASLESKMENINKESAERIKVLEGEVDALKLELERAKTTEEKLTQAEASLEQLGLEVGIAKNAESQALELVDDWKQKLSSLEVSLEASKKSEKCAKESLAAVLKKLEEGSSLLQDAESEIATLNGKVGSLESKMDKYKFKLEESDRKLDFSQQETMSLRQTIEVLKLELQKLEDEKVDEIKNKKCASSNSESFSHEKQKLTDELNASKEEGMKLKKAMEGLTSALHEMSTDFRENQERMFAKQSEIDDAQAQIEGLNLALKNLEEKYEVMLDEARYEIVCLKKSVEKFGSEESGSNVEWDKKEINLVNAIKESENELSSLTVEMAKLMESVNEAEQEAEVAKAEKAEILGKLQEVELQAASAYEQAEKVRAESLQMKEKLWDKENELQSIYQENDDLRTKASVAEQKIKELSALLAETTMKKVEQNGKLSCKGTRINESIIEISKSDLSPTKYRIHRDGYNKSNEVQRTGRLNDRDGNSLDFSYKHEEELGDDYSDVKLDDDNYDQISIVSESIASRASSLTMQQKKKKHLLGKFGNMLKKKGSQKWRNST